MDQDTNKETSQDQENNKKPYIPATQAADIYTSPTAAVDPHNTQRFANTGTNNSYEGAIAAGSGGSVGTGEASGQPADGSRITTTRADETGEIARTDEQQDSKVENTSEPNKE